MKGKSKNTRHNSQEENIISRKKAIKKLGYAAFSAGTMMILLNNPAKASNSPELPPDWGDGDGWG